MGFKTVKARVDFQVKELVSNLSDANTAKSDQKKAYFTSKAMYNASRLSTLIGNATISA